MSTLTHSVNRFFSHKRFDLIAFALLAGIILIVYSNTFTAGFHFDDTPSILENQNIKRVTTENISRILHGVRPVVYFSLMLNYQLNGSDVTGYHVFNVAVHIACSFLVYLLIGTTLSLPVFKEKYAGKATRMGFLGALLFAVHPIQTEAVTYIISRTELLATVFYLLAVVLFIKGVQKRHAFSFYSVGVFFSAVLAMSSKEWAVTLPAILMLYDYLFLSDRNIKDVLSHAPAFVLAALPWGIILNNLNLFTNTSVGFNMASVTTTGEAPPTVLTYLLTSLNVLWTYIRILFLPISQNLDYEYPMAKTLFEFPTLLSLVGHVLLVGAAWWAYIKKGWLLIPFGVAWFYIVLSPVHSFVPVKDLIFEHRMYMPSIGFFIIFVVAYEGVFEWINQRER